MLPLFPIYVMTMIGTTASDTHARPWSQLTHFRASTLYKAFVAKLLVDLGGPQLASLLMRHSLWLPYLISAASLITCFPLLYIMPETLNFHTSKAAEPSSTTHAIRTGWYSSMRTMACLVADRYVSIWLLFTLLVQLRYNALQLFPPYVSVKFGWKISDAS